MHGRVGQNRRTGRSGACEADFQRITQTSWKVRGPLHGRIHSICAFGSMRQHAGGFAAFPICRTACNDGQLRSTNPLLWVRAGGGNVLSRPVWTSGRSCLWVPSRVREELSGAYGPQFRMKREQRKVVFGNAGNPGIRSQPPSFFASAIRTVEDRGPA